jgi:hypothetical protein
VDITAEARDHLFSTIDRQYEPDDAETLKAMLTTTSSDSLATKQDIAELRAGLLAELHSETGALRIEFKDAIHEQTRVFISWMFGLLTVYTAMAGTLVAIGTILLTR